MKVIDLTLTYEKGMRGVSIDTSKTKAIEGWNSNTLHLYSHAGTHMDAPFHFEVSDKTIEKYRVERFICDSWVIPIKAKPNQKISVDDMGRFQEKIQEGDGVILKTGWSEYINTPKYRNELPGIHETLANWFVKKNINLLAIEPPSVAIVTDLIEETKIHTVLLKGDIIIIEGLTNLEGLSKEIVKLIALPLKIKNGDGAPTRVIAIE